MVAWLDIHGVSDLETRREYCQIIAVLDTLWLEVFHEQIEQKRKMSANKSAPPKGSPTRPAPSFR